jgi:hypothetical protein
MSDEKRRYFRINEKVGLAIEWLDAKEVAATGDMGMPLRDEERKIKRLLAELRQESPKVAELCASLNDKLNGIIRRFEVESETLTRVVSRIREVNISACGLGFVSDQAAQVGRHMRCELELTPAGKSIITRGVLVACDTVAGGFYWRVEFYGMSNSNQEQLIQHIVQRQSAQLKNRR